MANNSLKIVLVTDSFAPQKGRIDDYDSITELTVIKTFKCDFDALNEEEPYVVMSGGIVVSMSGELMLIQRFPNLKKLHLRAFKNVPIVRHPTLETLIFSDVKLITIIDCENLKSLIFAGPDVFDMDFITCTQSSKTVTIGKLNCPLLESVDSPHLIAVQKRSSLPNLKRMPYPLFKVFDDEDEYEGADFDADVVEELYALPLYCVRKERLIPAHFKPKVLDANVLFYSKGSSVDEEKVQVLIVHRPNPHVGTYPHLKTMLVIDGIEDNTDLTRFSELETIVMYSRKSKIPKGAKFPPSLKRIVKLTPPPIPDYPSIEITEYQSWDDIPREYVEALDGLPSRFSETKKLLR